MEQVANQIGTMLARTPGGEISSLVDRRIERFLDAKTVSQEDLEKAVHEAADKIVYFIQAVIGGPIKIGTSRRDKLSIRLGALQTGSAYRLRVTRTFPGGRGLEQLLHLLFREARMEGEWFWPIDSLCETARALPPPPEVALHV